MGRYEIDTDDSKVVQIKVVGVGGGQIIDPQILN